MGHKVSRAGDSNVGPRLMSCRRSGNNLSMSCIVSMVRSRWISNQRRISALVKSFFIDLVLKCFSGTPTDSEPGEKWTSDVPVNILMLLSSS